MGPPMVHRAPGQRRVDRGLFEQPAFRFFERRNPDRRGRRSGRSGRIGRTQRRGRSRRPGDGGSLVRRELLCGWRLLHRPGLRGLDLLPRRPPVSRLLQEQQRLHRRAVLWSRWPVRSLQMFRRCAVRRGQVLPGRRLVQGRPLLQQQQRLRRRPVLRHGHAGVRRLPLQRGARARRLRRGQVLSGRRRVPAGRVLR